MNGVRYEKTYAAYKRGFYNTRRYPWGSTKGDPSRANPNGIQSFHSSFYTAVGSSVALVRNDQRRFLQIQNMSLANDIVFLFGGTASLNDGVTLTPGQVEIFDVAVPIESLAIFCAAALQRVALIEGY